MARLRLPETGDHLAADTIRLRRRRRQSAPLALPVIFHWRGDMVAVIPETHLVSSDQFLQRRLYFWSARIAFDSIVQRGGDVFHRAVNTLHVLQQTDCLGDRLSERVVNFARNIIDLAPNFAGYVACYQVIDLINARQFSQGLFSQVDIRVDEELLRQLDDRPVWESIEDRSYEGNARGQYAAYFALRPLLFAQAHRRRADNLMDVAKRDLYSKHIIKEHIASELSKSQEMYDMLTSRQRDNTHIAAVAWHGAGRLAYKRIHYARMFGHNQEGPFHYSDRLVEVKEFYEKSVLIAQQAGFDYAPPFNALAWIKWITYREKRGDWDQETRVVSIEECLSLLNRAIETSEQQYAPPLLLKANVIYRLQIEKDGGEPDIKQIAELIHQAVKLSPYDSMVQDEVNAFSRMLLNETAGDAEGAAQYREIRFAVPTQATKDSLNGYLLDDSIEQYPCERDQLLVLRRWSSYTPLIKVREHSSVGGGYLLQWRGTQVAIDPGIGFIRNLHKYGHRVQNLDAIITTHQHIDHADDTEAILSIIKSNGNRGSDGRVKTAPRFLLTKSGVERWAGMVASALDLPSADGCVEELTPCRHKSKVYSVGDIEITPVPLHNHQDALDEVSTDGVTSDGSGVRGRLPTGCGLVMRLHPKSGQECVVGITSDTGYIDGNSDASADLTRASDYYRECDIVVLHLSTVDDLNGYDYIHKQSKKFIEYECEWASSMGYSGMLYKKHLGFWGVVLFIRDLIVSTGRSDRIIILSEFGEETLKNRVALLNEICRIIGSIGDEGTDQAKRIVIGDIGTQIRLPSGDIGCNFGLNHCPQTSDHFLEFDECHGDISMPHRGWNDRGLFHLCRTHDELLRAPHSLNQSVWGYMGYPVLDEE